MGFRINGIYALNQRYAVPMDFTGHRPGYECLRHSPAAQASVVGYQLKRDLLNKNLLTDNH